ARAVPGRAAPVPLVAAAQWTAIGGFAIRPPGERSVTVPSRFATLAPSPVILGMLCGAGAAFFWAAGFAAARHGIAIGFSPADLAVHRFAWAGIFLLPLLGPGGLRDFGGIGWRRALLL